MGNANSDVTSGVKAQAQGAVDYIPYQFVDVKGGGELVELMKKANRTKNYKELDTRIREGLRPHLYNDGAGAKISIRDMVKARMQDKGVPVDKISDKTDKKNKHNEEKHDGINGNLKQNYEECKEVCWHMNQRGALGETALHVCFLLATSVHYDLAKRMLRIYPKLINDIYMSDMFYGENVLHMGIVNEDPAMVKFLLDNDADYHQRACGKFFCPDDQKKSRSDSLEHEWVDTCLETDYEGYTYWGEYALGFAACLGQEECVRLLRAKGADPNLQDFNGNTVLHCLVIHDKKEMFDLLVDLKADIHVKNRQGLTPLTLAAKLARREMYEHILTIERDVCWIYGNVTCAAYPLEHIDTISAKGEINTNSAMYHVVYGEEQGHLDMIDGIIGQLLQEKWKTFAKYRFIRRFIIFALYFAIFIGAFLLRPGTDREAKVQTRNITNSNGTLRFQNVTVKDSCYLLRANTTDDIARLTLEAVTLFGAMVYIFLSLKEIYHQGYAIFLQTLRASPAKTLFLMANFFVLLMVPGRAACAYEYEDVMAILAILTTAPYFLFFCRGFTIVGPFVVMIYKMIRTDLFRFFVIYLIFVVGFSQALYIVYRGQNTKIFHHPVESMMGMFIMSLGEFTDIYESFGKTRLPDMCKFIFMLYMILVTLLLVNMLIAMMGNTYQMVNESTKEWLRQWANIILVVEQTVSTDERRKQQINYSQAMKGDRRAFVTKWHQTEKEQEEIKEWRKLQQVQERSMLDRKHEKRLLRQLGLAETFKKSTLVKDRTANNEKPQGS